MKKIFRFNIQQAKKAVCRIMKTGNGSSIVNAGTAKMPIKMRRTSRIIKNAL